MTNTYGLDNGLPFSPRDPVAATRLLRHRPRRRIGTSTVRPPSVPPYLDPRSSPHTAGRHGHTGHPPPGPRSPSLPAHHTRCPSLPQMRQRVGLGCESTAARTPDLRDIFDVPTDIRQRVQRLAEQSESSGAASGVKPSGFVATCLYKASHKEGRWLTQAEVTEMDERIFSLNYHLTCCIIVSRVVAS